MQPPPAAQAPGPALRGVRAGAALRLVKGAAAAVTLCGPHLRAPVACAWGAHAARGRARGAGPNGWHFSHEGSRPLLWPAARGPRRLWTGAAAGRRGPGRKRGPAAPRPSGRRGGDVFTDTEPGATCGWRP